MAATSRHLKVRIDEQLAAGLGRLASRRGVSVSDAVRALIVAQIQIDEGRGPTLESLHAAVLASLLAAELAVQLLTRQHPGGQAAVLGATDIAADQARRRLDQVEQYLADGASSWRR